MNTLIVLTALLGVSLACPYQGCFTKQEFEAFQCPPNGVKQEGGRCGDNSDVRVSTYCCFSDDPNGYDTINQNTYEFNIKPLVRKPRAYYDNCSHRKFCLLNGCIENPTCPIDYTLVNDKMRPCGDGRNATWCCGGYDN